MQGLMIRILGRPYSRPPAMFESFSKHDSVPLNQALVLCGIGAGVGVGTCGLGALIQNERVSPIVLTIGAVFFWGSLVGFLIIGLLSVARFIFDRLRK